MNIISKVENLIKSHNTNCPFKIAKSIGIQVVFEPLGNTLGYYNRHFRIKIIHINQDVDDYKKKFICAHELGHAIFHPDANTPFLKKNTLFSTEKIEIEANYFAIQLLFGENNYSNSILLEESIDKYGMNHKIVSKFLEHKFF